MNANRPFSFLLATGWSVAWLVLAAISVLITGLLTFAYLALIVAQATASGIGRHLLTFKAKCLPRKAKASTMVPPDYADKDDYFWRNFGGQEDFEMHGLYGFTGKVRPRQT